MVRGETGILSRVREECQKAVARACPEPSNIRKTSSALD